MYQPRTKRIARVVATALLGSAIAIGTSGVAFASPPDAHAGISVYSPVLSLNGRLSVRAHDEHQHHRSHGFGWTHVSGTITALGSLSVTLKRSNGTTSTYATTTATTYFEGSASTTVAALALGEQVDLVLTSTAPQDVVKLTIDVIKFTGRVTTISGDTITLTDHSRSESVVVSSGTVFTLAGGGTATLADVLVGDQISATGVNGVGVGILDANSVVIGSFL